MKLHILSDLHLEFSAFVPPVTDADVIVMAGDIDKGNNGVYWARETFPDKPILYVPGNHEFYGTRRSETLRLLRIAGRQTGVRILDEDEVLLDGVRFLGCTLWTDFLLFGNAKKNKAMTDGGRWLNDFRAIREGDAVPFVSPAEPFTPVLSIKLHERSLAWLKAKLAEPFDGRTVVVTHHLPSMLSVADRFKDDQHSVCFASELRHLFGKMDLWIHGHTHDNIEYEANGTRVICNPRGFVTRTGAGNFYFKPALVVEID